MKVEKNMVIALSYTLYKDNEKGEILEVCKAEKPLEFVFGTGLLLPKFEENIVNLSEGDDFDFVLSPADAYGEKVDEAVVEVPLEIFKINGVVQKDILFEGSEIPMRDAQGNPMTGKVVRLDEEKNVVVMDFNHPLAGINLYFSGKIESIREATEDEIANGLHRGCGGCGGGCGSGSCGGGCGDEKSEGGCCGGCH
ncbi:MAG: FKBP-type peptidyl-prolyl cis-trans isomerase [Bacteroidales bacterium]|nr:FKBP-type peptidyl-prolyl cis-trans isomerase [Bacteroidales bacterium]